jgi:hypothetical protein
MYSTFVSGTTVSFGAFQNKHLTTKDDDEENDDGPLVGGTDPA